MRDQAAARAPRGMLHMQHLVKQNIFDRELRHARAVHAPVQQNVIWPGIVASELPAPAFLAPSDVRALKLAVKICGVQVFEKFFQIEMPSLRPGRMRRRRM